MSAKANLRSSAQARFSKLLTKPPESFRWNLPTAKIVESASLDYRGNVHMTLRKIFTVGTFAMLSLALAHCDGSGTSGNNVDQGSTQDMAMPPPVITSVAPGAVSNGGGVSITITGTGLLILGIPMMLWCSVKYPKFFTYLNLFVFAMLALVLGGNMLVTFLGWAGVGACSYFLIGFWFEKDANASAAKKAFVTNRIGDWGFLVAMFVTFFTFGSLSYSQILPQAAGLAMGTATIIAVMCFVGAVGKSAQIPLFIWLPDAMAGPTPVSALIHAATMVTAGVYMVVRSHVLFEMAPQTLEVVAIVGAATALMAAQRGMEIVMIRPELRSETLVRRDIKIGTVAERDEFLSIQAALCLDESACTFLDSGEIGIWNAERVLPFGIGEARGVHQLRGQEPATSDKIWICFGASFHKTAIFIEEEDASTNICTL